MDKPGEEPPPRDVVDGAEDRANGAQEERNSCRSCGYWLCCVRHGVNSIRLELGRVYSRVKAVFTWAMLEM